MRIFLMIVSLMLMGCGGSSESTLSARGDIDRIERLENGNFAVSCANGRATYVVDEATMAEEISADSICDFPLEDFVGIYQGSMTTTHPDVNFPERIMFELIFDPSAPVAHQLTGYMRFYLGSFGSQEFIELPFSELSLDASSGEFTAKTSAQDYGLYLAGRIAESGEYVGVMSTDTFGEVGDLALQKL